MEAPLETTSGRMASVAVDDRPKPATAREATIKAIVRDAYGSTDVLHLQEVDKPEPRDDEVLVRVHAAGVDRGIS